MSEMTVEQQKIIKSFLNDESGEPGGKELFAAQEEMLITLINNIENRSQNRMKTPVQTILPV